MFSWSIQRRIGTKPFNGQIQKCPHALRGLAALAMHHMHWQCGRLEIAEHRLEPSIAHMLGHLVGQQPCQTKTTRDRRHGSVVGVRGEARLHPQTLLALTYDGQPLPPKYGFPMKLRRPTKLGYKNPKHIQAIFVTNTYPGGYWEDQGYNWFGGS